MKNATRNNISIPSDIADKVWFRHAVTVQLYLYLCLNACQKDEEVKEGVKLGKGQILTSQRKMADELGMARTTLQRSINSLKGYGEITVEDMGQNGLKITICKRATCTGHQNNDILYYNSDNYNGLQSVSGPPKRATCGPPKRATQNALEYINTQEITMADSESVGHLSGPPTKEKEKFPPHPPYKEKENFGGGGYTCTYAREKKIIEKLKANEIWMTEGPCRILKITPSECKEMLEEFEADNVSRMKNEHWTLKRAGEHFMNWMNNKKRIEYEQFIRQEQFKKRAELHALSPQERRQRERDENNRAFEEHILCMLRGKKDRE